MQFLNRLTLWQKLALLVLAMATPCILLGGFYLTGSNSRVSLARDELQGARYIQSVGAMLAESSNHRSRLFAVLTGDEARREELVTSDEAMDRLVAQTDVIDAKVGTQFDVSRSWQTIKSDWMRLKQDGPKLTPEIAVVRHNELLAQLSQLSQTVISSSGLAVEPSPETAALIQIATQNVPGALLAAGNIRWYATRAAIKGYVGADDRLALQLYQDQFGVLVDRTGGNLAHVPAEANVRVRPAFDSARAAFTTAYATVREKLLETRTITITTADVYSATGELASTLQRLSDTSYESMEAAVQGNLDHVTANRTLTLGITVLALALALMLSWLIARSMSVPLASAVGVFGHIAAGRYDNAIEHRGTDEACQVLQALDQMQSKLRVQIETERGRAAENARIRQALDKVSTAVMLADAHYQIIYLNDAARDLFGRTQPEIRKTLPHFEAARLLGQSLDVITADPIRMRHILDHLSGSHLHERMLGGCTIRSVASVVHNAQGERIGTVIEWSDRTPEVAVEQQLQGMLSGVVAGDLTQRIDLNGKTGFFEAMSRGVNQLADNIAQIVSGVKRVTAEVHQGAHEIAAGNANLSQRTEEQSSSLEETASSMDQMTTTVKHNADNAAQANQLAVAAREQAEKGGAVVTQAVRAMAQIKDASTRIAAIIRVIDDIAFQTNLLALNAAVEAARAGEQGRGFAVVASEVRALAGRSATAAKEIKSLIEDSVHKVEGGSDLVTQSGDTLEKIVLSVKKVSDIVAEIAAASREQSSGIDQVNRAVTQMDELTQQNAALVEQATGASQTMAEQVRELNELLARYRVNDSPATATAVDPADSDLKHPLALAAATPSGARQLLRHPQRGHTMIRQISALVVVMTCAIAPLAHADDGCFLPAPPSKTPDGKTASEQQMESALETVRRYQADVDTYLKCLEFAVKQGTLRGNEEARLHNDAVDTLQRVANQFNAQVKTFKARNG
jgi:methyl-accepting chemotaxis protein